jgi:DNA mismatch repair protein MutL
MSEDAPVRPPRIRILDDEVAERIAAGEVVERPASAVKELVENSLDAGARRIAVETRSGGKVLLRVADDGCGMTPEEARLALRRHATSKLRNAEDLHHVRTLGFRGEALPSIAAVSELELLTRVPEEQVGTRLLVSGGVELSLEATAAPVGTRVTVRRLFYNVPVRERFLRSDAVEGGHITEWLQRLALARPEVSFRLSHDGREVLLTPGAEDPLNTLVAVLGRGVAREALRVTGPAQAAGSDVQVHGYVCRPSLTRSTRGQQWFYVNGRFVRSPLLYRALDEAFRATMPQGRHPVAVLFVELAPEAVDVNVHPAKTEVRFRHEAAVSAAVTDAVRAALAAEQPVAVGPAAAARALPLPPDSDETPGAGALPYTRAVLGGPGSSQGRTTERGSTAGGRSAGAVPAPLLPADPFAEPGLATAPPPLASPAPPPLASPAPPPPPLTEEPAAPGEHPPAPGREPAALTPQAPPVLLQRGEFAPETGAALVPRQLRLLGQVRDLFILAEGDDRLWVVDQHVAHERVLFDRLIADAERVGEAPQRLLLPPVLRLDVPGAQALQEHLEVLAELGFAVEQCGERAYRLAAVPRSQVGRNYEVAFRDMVEELAESSRGGALRLRKEEVAAAAAGRACKRAVKAGQRLGSAEMSDLLAQLAVSRNPHTCPHGRPVFLAFSEAEVAELFGATHG